MFSLLALFFGTTMGAEIGPLVHTNICCKTMDESAGPYGGPPVGIHPTPHACAEVCCSTYGQRTKGMTIARDGFGHGTTPGACYCKSVGTANYMDHVGGINNFLDSYDVSCSGKWTTLFAKGSFGSVVKTKAEFNTLARASVHGILRRQCADCEGTHKDVFYKRKTAPQSFDYYEGLLVTWRGDVGFHSDFDIYPSLTDAKHGTNPWAFCNGNDPGIGFPRDCGPWAVGHQWNSLTRGGRASYRWSALAHDDDSPSGMADGTVCVPAISCDQCTNDAHFWWGKLAMACGEEPRWGDGTRCALGTSCNTCKNSATWWLHKAFTACGREPCWGGNTLCGSGTTCNFCCNGSRCPWYWFGVCKCN